MLTRKLAARSMRNAISTLGVWQRLWVALSVVWLVAVAAHAFSVFPTQSRMLAVEQARVSESYGRLAENNRELREECGALFRKGERIELLEQCYKLVHEGETHYRKSTEEQMRRAEIQVKEMQHQVQALAVARALAFWLLPAALFYLLGLAVRWIRVGRSAGG